MKTNITQLLIGLLFVFTTLAGERNNPPPADKSWFLLSDNEREDPITPQIVTDLVYWYDIMPNAPRDRKGALDTENYEVTGPVYMEGHRLLDNDYPNPSWHTVVGWAPQNGSPTITFDLKKKFIVTRLDIQVHPDNGGGGRSPAMVPENIVYYLNETNDWKNEKNWKKVGELDIDSDDMPNWLLSKFSKGTARFVRIEVTPKRGNTMYLKEVRIWGIKP